jgi:hypothetical protein
MVRAGSFMGRRPSTLHQNGRDHQASSLNFQAQLHAEGMADESTGADRRDH